MICSHSCKHYQHTERTTGAANFSGGKAVRIFSSRIWCQTTTTCMWACMCYMHTHTHAHMCAHTHTHTHMRTHTHKHTHTYVHTLTHTVTTICFQSHLVKTKTVKREGTPANTLFTFRVFLGRLQQGATAPQDGLQGTQTPVIVLLGGQEFPEEEHKWKNTAKCGQNDNASKLYYSF